MSAGGAVTLVSTLSWRVLKAGLSGRQPRGPLIDLADREQGRL